MASEGKQSDEPPERDLAALDDLVSLHESIDKEAGRLTLRHASRLECRKGCSACCLDGLTVFEVEADLIRREFPAVLDEEPGPRGGCAFLDSEGACRVYAHRPYVCRTQGLPLQFFAEDEDGEIVERRDICELNIEGEPLSGLDMDEMWTIGPTELELQRLQDRHGANEQRRIALRALFKR